MVEFALVAPLLLLFLLGIVDFGSVWSDKLLVRSTVREATRSAVVGRYSATGGLQTCELVGLGGVPTPATESVMCRIKSQFGDPGRVRVKVELLDGETGAVGAPHAYQNNLMVCAMTELSSLSGLFASLLDHKAASARQVMMIERDPALHNVAPLGPAAEAPLSGSDWSFCSPSQPAP